MGFDVYGTNGSYCRNSVWWWRPLWFFILDACPNTLTSEEKMRGFFNDRLFIPEAKALVIGRRLMTLTGCGETEEWGNRFQAEKASSPDDLCSLCAGTGITRDHGQTCERCKGSGSSDLAAGGYKFSVENVLKFAQFCLESGGFWIT